MVFVADPDIAQVLFRDEEKWPCRDFSSRFRIFLEERRALGLVKRLLERYAPTLVESVYAIRQRLTPFSFVLLSFLLFRVTLSAKDLWRKGARFHTGAPMSPS